MSDRIDYGPLESLMGTWEGDRGVDKSPEPEGTETTSLEIYGRRFDHTDEDRLVRTSS